MCVCVRLCHACWQFDSINNATNRCVCECVFARLRICLFVVWHTRVYEWVSDVRKWSMSIAHSSNSSSVWFAWPSIKQYPHRHLLSTQLKRTHAHARAHTQSTPHLIYVITPLRSSTIFHFECVWVCLKNVCMCLKFDFAALVTTPPYHDDGPTAAAATAAYTSCNVRLQIPAQMSHMIYSDRESERHTQ